jgi:hypothetical protein
MTVRNRVFLVSLAVLGLANHLGAEESKAGAQSPEISGIVAHGQPAQSPAAPLTTELSSGVLVSGLQRWNLYETTLTAWGLQGAELSPEGSGLGQVGLHAECGPFPFFATQQGFSTGVGGFALGDPLVSLGQDCEGCWFYQGDAIRADLVDYGPLTCCPEDETCPGCEGYYSEVHEYCAFTLMCGTGTVSYFCDERYIHRHNCCNCVATCCETLDCCPEPPCAYLFCPTGKPCELVVIEWVEFGDLVEHPTNGCDTACCA